MATASIDLPGGAKVVIEGTQAEVASLLAKFGGNQPSSTPRSERSSSKPAIKREGPMNLILGLIQDEFFQTPKELRDVRVALEERGHFYPTTSLSPLMLRLVRNKQLRRIKTRKRWTYVR